MECPACHDPDAYVGIHEVDCLNPDCANFKEPYLEAKLKEAEAGFDAVVEYLGVGDELSDILAELWIQEISKLGIPKSLFDKDTKCDS